MNPNVRHPFRRFRGFLLLEVILAVTLFGIAATALVVALHRTAEAAETARRELRVSRVLDSSLREALSLPAIEPGQSTRVLEEMRMEVDTVIEPLEIENEDGQLLQGMFRIRVTVLWPEDGIWHERSAETFRYAQMYQSQ